MDAMKALQNRVLAGIGPRMSGVYSGFVIALLSLTQLMVALDFHFGKLAVVLFMKGARLTLAYSHERAPAVSQDTRSIACVKAQHRTTSDQCARQLPTDVAGCTNCG
jgi:hypothetical protein